MIRHRQQNTIFTLLLFVIPLFFSFFAFTDTAEAQMCSNWGPWQVNTTCAPPNEGQTRQTAAQQTYLSLYNAITANTTGADASRQDAMNWALATNPNARCIYHQVISCRPGRFGTDCFPQDERIFGLTTNTNQQGEPGGPGHAGRADAQYRSESRVCLDPPPAQQCVWESELRWDWDGNNGRTRCMNQFQQFSTAIPLCRDVGVVSGTDATNATISSCLPYNNGGEACPVGLSRYEIYTLKRSNSCPAITQPPATPSNLAATPGSCGTGQITVTWSSVAGATNYEISVSGGGWFPVGNVTVWNHTGLVANSGHNYRVRAINSAGASPESGQVNVNAPNICAPATPAGLATTPQSCGSGVIRVSWNGVAGASGYNISINGGTFTNVGNVTSWDHTGLPANAIYSYQVQAWNGAGAGPASGTVNANAPNVCAPGTPTGLAATPQSCGSGTIRLSWNPVAGATNYEVSVNGGGWSPVGTVTTWNSTGLTPNSFNSYRVRAVNGAGAGPESGAVNATAPNVCVPAMPASITGSCPAPGSNATISWPAVPGATTYELRVDNQTSGGWNGTCNASAGDFCESLPGTSRAFTSTPGHQYNTWVHACNAGGCSAPVSSVFSCAVAVPTGLTVTPQACGTNQLFLDWADVPGATSYSVYYSNGVWVANTGGSNYTFTGGLNTPYSFYVRANGASGQQSGNSAIVGGTTPNTCPTLPDLKANGSDGPLGVGYGVPVNLTWTSTGASSACILSGAAIPSGSQIVTPNGNIAITVTQSSLYTLTCGTETDPVQINLDPQPPNAPTINFPSGSTAGIVGSPVQFRITATHPNPTSQFYYTIDWDNNGSNDAPSPSPTYTSGQQWVIDNTWVISGSITVRACARDIANAFAPACTTHTVVLTPPPPPSVTLLHSINGGPFVGGNPTLNPVDTLSLRWLSVGANSCTAIPQNGFSTGPGNPTTGTDSVIPPSPGTSAEYTISCTGFGGTQVRVVGVTTRNHPNFTQPNISFLPSAGFDPATGVYDFVDVIFQTRNDGGSETLTTATYEFQFDRGQDGYEFTNTGSITNPFVAGAVFNSTERVSNVSFGAARARVAIDIPLPNGVVTEMSEGNNNVRVSDFIVPPPNPGLSITADREQLLFEDTTVIRWSTIATYPSLSCTVLGPGIAVPAPAPFSGSQATQPIRAKSEYTFTCVETITGTTWSDSVSVETQGELQEI